MKSILFLNLLFVYCFPVLAQSLNEDQLNLLRQSFCKKINGKHKLGGVAPYARDLATLSQVPEFDASTRFAKNYNTILHLSESASRYKEDHRKNLELQRKFIKEFFVDNVGNSKLEYGHFLQSVSGDISMRDDPIFIFKKHSIKISCHLFKDEIATQCDFGTMTVEENNGKKHRLCEVETSVDKLPEESRY